MDLKGRRILVTGGAGFFGRHIVRALSQREPADVFTFRSREYDLLNAAAVRDVLHAATPDVVIHAAGKVGGIGANRRFPGTFFYENAMMGLNLIEQCRSFGTPKVLVVGTICSYPKIAPLPMTEESLWDGYPEETNAPYGLAKKMLLVHLQAYREQYGMNGVYLMPVNLFGPGDNGDPENSHVIPALIRKCLEAKAQGASTIKLWGTGTATREFLYVEDAAEAVVLAAERYDGAAPLNLGGQGEISIADLVKIIARLTGYNGDVEWDAQMPDGQPRRAMDASRARQAFGFNPKTTLEEGLKKTVEWLCAARR